MFLAESMELRAEWKGRGGGLCCSVYLVCSNRFPSRVVYSRGRPLVYGRAHAPGDTGSIRPVVTSRCTAAAIGLCLTRVIIYPAERGPREPQRALPAPRAPRPAPRARDSRARPLLRPTTTLRPRLIKEIHHNNYIVFLTIEHCGLPQSSVSNKRVQRIHSLRNTLN